MNISNLKVSRIGWSKIYAANSSGMVRCILIKKNLFKGYTLIDESGIKISLDNLSTLQDWIVISNERTMFANVNEFRRSNDALDFVNTNLTNERVLHTQIQQQITAKVNELTDEMTQSEAEHKKQIDDINSKKQSEMYGRISYLSNPFEHVATEEWQIDGTNVVYKQPNEYQKKMGWTSIPTREPYSSSGTDKVNMSEYLGYLLEEIQDEFKPQVQILIDEYKKLRAMLEQLEKEYSNELYVRTVAAETIFTQSLANFFIAYTEIYKGYETMYYNSSSRNQLDDETETTIIKVRDLISSGKNTCSKLIEMFLGEERKKQFEDSIDVEMEEKVELQPEEEALTPPKKM